jgi:hypothetical protein
MDTKNSEELITKEFETLKLNTQKLLPEIKKIAIDEAWKLLQITLASIIQIIENIGNDLSGPEKKKLALSLISNFYDTTFDIIDVPYVPNILESYVHKYVKRFLMILVSSSIDSMVTIFRSTGVFLKKTIEVTK